MRDLQLRTPGMFAMVQEESNRQIAKWGVRNHNPYKWDTIVHEEVGEVSKAILEHEIQGGSGFAANAMQEAIQAATLYLKIAEMYHEEWMHELAMERKQA